MREADLLEEDLPSESGFGGAFFLVFSEWDPLASFPGWLGWVGLVGLFVFAFL